MVVVRLPVGQGITDSRVPLYCHTDNKENGPTHGNPEFNFLFIGFLQLFRNVFILFTCKSDNVSKERSEGARVGNIL